MFFQTAAHPLARQGWLITGQVQGVGFRPFVFRTARRLELSGSVKNVGDAVVIECQGDASALAQFDRELSENHPPLARICEIKAQDLPVRPGESGFWIESSSSQVEATHPGSDVTPDAAACPSCVRETLDPKNRRHGYALTTCTDCGPRYSIIRGIPYDRCNTTMAGFEMCPACREEYSDPSDRRFHAQPIACHDCGPKLQIVESSGNPIDGEPIDVARDMLRTGRIVAIKGLGGFHLATLASDEQAVARLRKFKKRDHKPFALMVRSIDEARQLVDLSDSAAGLMQSPACPIVLAVRKSAARIATSVAPGNHRLGVMLPYTPIHHLLFHPELPPLVMTSGNVSDEPLTIENSDALVRLGPMCDAILWHDRPIQRGVDDSVLIDIGEGEPIPLRRARGYVPRAISLPIEAKTEGICLGGELKNTIAVVRGRSAILSHHLGDLTHPLAFGAFVHAARDLRELFGIRPCWVAHDLHPVYLSSDYARKLAAELDVPLIAVQHHHAHAASLMAEHGIDQRILAVVCDGTGYGLDGTIWGGELLSADLRGFGRLARLPSMRLAGGDAAARDTSRCALALLYQAYGGERFEDHPITRALVPENGRRAMLARVIRDNIACATSSGAGRVFDGVAALLRLCDHNHFEAQAAMMLEAAASRCDAATQSSIRNESQDLFEIVDQYPREISLSPLIRALVDRQERGDRPERLAGVFHEQFARAWSSVVIEASRQTGLDVVGLSGGVFCNAILTLRLVELLEAKGLRVLRHQTVPPNDGGLSLGQAAVAAARSVRRS